MKIILSGDDFGRSHEMNLAIDHAMRHGMICSTALIMGSEFTEEAVEMARQGGYIQNVHCHLNLAACRSVGNHFVPLNEDYKKSRFCKNGEFASAWYYKPDFMKYRDVIFQELETQFLTFRSITEGQANYEHIDFHLYMNFSLPVAAAYHKLIEQYQIKTARFFGEHQKEEKNLWNPLIISMAKRSKACVVKSSKIEYYLLKQKDFKNETTIELYVHPEYRDGLLIDRTNSVFGNGFKTLEEQLSLVKASGPVEFIPWTAYRSK